jgi:hypothetical protein
MTWVTVEVPRRCCKGTRSGRSSPFSGCSRRSRPSPRRWGGISWSGSNLIQRGITFGRVGREIALDGELAPEHSSLIGRVDGAYDVGLDVQDVGLVQDNVNTCIRNRTTVGAFFNAFVNLLGYYAHNSWVYSRFLSKRRPYHGLFGLCSRENNIIIVSDGNS